MRAHRSIYRSVGEDGGTWRVIKNAIEAILAKVAKAKPRAMALTQDGNRTLRERAKLLGSWCDGQFERLNAYGSGKTALHDAMIYGSGAMLACEGLDGRPSLERVWVGDLGVESREEIQGAVRTLYRVAPVDRGVLKSAFKKYATAIEEAGNPLAWEDGTIQDDDTDEVLLVEAWRLPAGKLPGRHVMCIDNATLRDKEWKDDRFPIEFMHWSRDPECFFGVGLVESMAPIQAELDNLSSKINESHDRMSPKLLVPNGAEISVEQMAGVPWETLGYTGPNPPSFATPPAIASDAVSRERQLIDGIYEMHGVSQLSAESSKPAGLNSGKAMAVYSDIESVRFQMIQQDYEALYVGLARQLIRVAEEIAESESPDSEKLMALGGKRSLKAVKYADVRFGDEPMVLRVFPVSSLSSTPAGRMAEVQGLLQSGIITDLEQARELLDFPDLARSNNLAAAGRKFVDRQVERCLAGKASVPDPYGPLDYALEHATLSLQLAEYDYEDMEGEEAEALDSGMEMLRDYIAAVETFMQPSPAETAEMQAADPMQGGATPSPPMPAMPAMG